MNVDRTTGQPRDDVFNAASHLVGTMLSLMGMVVLVVEASVQGKPWHIVAFAIYGLCMMALFLASTLHHSLHTEGKEELFRKLDYVAIFLLIAGTFTPLCLVLLRNAFGWSILGVVWGLAAIGIALVTLVSGLPPWVRVTMYIGMGWIGALVARPLMASIGLMGTCLLVLGGLFYTVGAVILASERPNLIPGRFEHHELWHVLVMLGALSHYLMIYFYVLPHP